MISDYEAISETLDAIALEAPVDFESFNYEGIKEISIMSVYEKYYEIINNPDLDEKSKTISLIAIISYLTMENTILHIQSLKGAK